MMIITNPHHNARKDLEQLEFLISKNQELTPEITSLLTTLRNYIKEEAARIPFHPSIKKQLTRTVLNHN